MATGVVKFFNTEKGFGFITRSGEPDVFVHFSNISGPTDTQGRRNLSDGQHVEFEIADGAKGPEARDVRVVDPPAVVPDVPPVDDGHTQAIDDLASEANPGIDQEAEAGE